MTPQQEQDRMVFAQWMLDQPENFPQRIIFGDESIWRLGRLSVNRQNWRYWAEENPHIVDEINNQGGKSYMCSVLMVDSHFQTKNFLSLVAGREKLIISHLWGVYILIFSPVGLLS